MAYSLAAAASASAFFAAQASAKVWLLGMIARHVQADSTSSRSSASAAARCASSSTRTWARRVALDSVVVVSTSDQPALVRVKELGSPLRWPNLSGPRAARQLHDGLGERGLPWPSEKSASPSANHPAARAYTPSVFAMLPRLMERLGTDSQGALRASTPSWSKRMI